MKDEGQPASPERGLNIDEIIAYVGGEAATTRWNNSRGDRELGLYFARARVKQGMTQRVLAAKSGVRQSAIAQIEVGMGNPTWRTLSRLGQALGLESVPLTVPEAS